MILILIPHYNNLEGLKLSLKSIHHRKAISVLVIDDGSRPEQKPQLADLQKIANPNVSVFVEYLDENKGITEALNHGLQLFIDDPKYNYIARLDCGDTCVRNRFHIQEEFLKNNESVSMIGSWVRFKNKKNEDLFTFKPPTEHKKIKKKMSIRCNFIHPSIMMERKVVEEIGMYPDQYEAAEDYAYFFKVSRNFETANINKCLTEVTIDPNGISSTQRNVQNKSKIKIIQDNKEFNIYYLYGMLLSYGLLIAPDSLVLKVKRLVMK
ncbi:MAG: glycosyltransferase [Crocinitomicaceae bacterium]|nr:glycosyltransferase [Crocinitomicaceae bacterium]